MSPSNDTQTLNVQGSNTYATGTYEYECCVLFIRVCMQEMKDISTVWWLQSWTLDWSIMGSCPKWDTGAGVPLSKKPTV